MCSCILDDWWCMHIPKHSRHHVGQTVVLLWQKRLVKLR